MLINRKNPQLHLNNDIPKASPQVEFKHKMNPTLKQLLAESRFEVPKMVGLHSSNCMQPNGALQNYADEIS